LKIINNNFFIIIHLWFLKILSCCILFAQWVSRRNVPQNISPYSEVYNELVNLYTLLIHKFSNCSLEKERTVTSTQLHPVRLWRYIRFSYPVLGDRLACSPSKFCFVSMKKAFWSVLQVQLKLPL